MNDFVNDTLRSANHGGINKWLDIKAEYTELGRTWVVARPAFVMEFYSEGHCTKDYGESILDFFLDLVPKEKDLFYIDSNSRQFKAFTSRAVNKVRKVLTEKNGSFMIKDAPEFAVNEYSIDMCLGSEYATLNDRVCISLPVDFADQPNTANAIECFQRFVQNIPVWGGVAGYGFDLVRGREYEQEGLPVMFKAASRFHGLQLRYRGEEDKMVKKLKSAGWLTFLDNELLALIGGSAHLNDCVSKAVSRTIIRGGVLLRAGEIPPVGDVNQQETDIALMAEVNKAIKPVRIQKWFSSNLFRVEKEVANAWLERLD